MMKIKDLKLKIVEKFKIFAPISLAIILIGVILMLIPSVGLNVGIDFAGGAKIEVDFGAYLETHEDIKDDLKLEVENVVASNGYSLGQSRWTGDSNTILELGLNYEFNGEKVDAGDAEAQNAFIEGISGEGDSLTSKIIAAATAFNAEFDENTVSVDTNIVNGATSQKLLTNAIIATAVAVVVMLIYIAFRFTLSSGIAAVIALLHDVLVMLALTTVFQIQVNTTFIAAIITIVGYSINATIVIFDRIREVEKLESMKLASDAEIANKSIVDTLGRSILTTATTLATIVVLAAVCAIIGVASMAEFALPIVFGLLAGAYSSVFLSASFWVYLRKLGRKITAKIKKANA